MELYKLTAMSTNSETKNNSDNPDNSSTNLGEQDKSEKVEVGDLILHNSKMDFFSVALYQESLQHDSHPPSKAKSISNC